MTSISLKRIGAVAAVASLVLVLAWYFAVFQPQTKKLSSAHKAHAVAVAQISQLKSQVSALDAVKAQIPADTKRLAALDAAVPGNPELATALQQIQAAATAAGVSVAEVGPSTPLAVGTTPSSGTTSALPSISVTMSASGSYSQVMAFLNGLKAMPRTVVVETLSLTGGPQGNAGSAGVAANIGARIFYAGQPTP